MGIFSVLLVTVAPAGIGAEPGGAYVKVDGREALLRSVELFLNREPIKQIQVVFTADDLEQGKQKYGGHLGFTGVKVISGGPRWVDQLAAGAEKILPEATHVVVHDAARPVVPPSDLDAILEVADTTEIAVLATPCGQTLVELDEGGSAMAFHPSRQFMQLLSPWIFTREKFIELAKSKKEPHASQVKLVNGSSLNIRVHSSRDAGLAKAMIALLPKPKLKPGNNPFEEAQW